MTSRQQRRRIRSWIAFALFVALMIGGGIGLAATNNMDNPFPFLSAGGTIDEFQPSSDDTRPEPPDVNVAGEMPARGEQGGLNIDLSQTGHVLFNLWFLGALSVAMMLIGTPLKTLRRRMRRAKQPAVAASSA